MIKIKKIKNSPIFSTTDKGNSIPTWKLSDPSYLWKNFKDGSKPVHLAYKIIGKFETAFPKKVKQKPKMIRKKKKPYLQVLKSLRRNQQSLFLVMLILSDQFSFKKSVFGVGLANENSTLVLNSLEQLGGSKELLEVRSKGRFNRSFDIVDQIEFKGEKYCPESCRNQ